MHPTQCFKINLPKSSASSFLTKNAENPLARGKSNADLFEELKNNNFERECLEERCNNYEFNEAVETLREEILNSGLNKKKQEKNLKNFDQIRREKLMQVYNSCYFRLKNGLEICDKMGTKSCKNVYNNYVCVCQKGYEGRNCERFVGKSTPMATTTTTIHSTATTTTTAHSTATTSKLVTEIPNFFVTKSSSCVCQIVTTTLIILILLT